MTANLNNMNIIYTLAVIVITLILNVTISSSMPYVKQRWNAFITKIKRKSNASKPVDCVMLETRVNELEKKLTKRQENYRKAIREEIKNILIELKNN